MDAFIDDLLSQAGNYETPAEPEQPRTTYEGDSNFNWDIYCSGAKLEQLCVAVARRQKIDVEDVDLSRGHVVLADPHEPDHPFHRHYYCEDVAGLERLIAQCAARRQNIHEKILGSMRPVIDVDAYAHVADSRGQSRYSIIDQIRAAMIEEVYDVISRASRSPPAYAGVDLDRMIISRGIRVSTSSDDDKFSYHLVVTGFRFKDAIALKGFTLAVRDRLLPALQDFIDVGLPKSKFNLRLLGAYKGDRLKVPHDGASTLLEDHLVAPSLATESFILGCPHYSSPKVLTGHLPIGDGERAIFANLVIGRFPFLVCRNDSGSSKYMNFDRTGSTICEICDRMHEHDSMYAWANSNRTTLSVQCRRASSDAACIRIPLAGVQGLQQPDIVGPDAQEPQQPVAVKQKIPYLRQICESASAKRATMIRQPSCSYSAPCIHAYPLDKRTLAIKASCGLGKTLAVFDYLRDIAPTVAAMKLERNVLASLASVRVSPGHPHYGEEYARWHDIWTRRGAEHPETMIVLFISYRRSLTYEMVKKAAAVDYPLESYRDIKENEIKLWHHRNVMVQVESLHRVTWVESSRAGVVTIPDVVILDEFSSILGQLDSRLVTQPVVRANSHETFRSAIRDAFRVIAIDALLDDWSIRILRLYRGDTPWTIVNTFEPHTEKRAVITGHCSLLVEKLYADLALGLRVIVPMHSKKFLEELFAEACVRFPKKTFKKVTGETSTADKDALCSNPMMCLEGVDALFYTPAISAGVSFEVPGFDLVYAFLRTGETVINVSESIQMLFRNRVTKEYWICIGSTHSGSSYTAEDVEAAKKAGETLETLPTTRVEMIEYIRGTERRSSVIARAPAELLHSLYGSVGIDNLDPRLEVFLRNQVLLNQAKLQFAAIFADQLFAFGIRASFWENSDTQIAERAKTLRRKFNEHREILNTASNELIASAPDLERKAAEVIIHKASLSEDDKAALAKYYLRLAYKYYAPITSDWVGEFNSFSRIAIFHRLNRIRTAGHSYLAAVDSIIETEERCKTNRRRGVSEYRRPDGQHLVYEEEANAEYEAEAHHWAVRMLSWIGFAQGIDSTNSVPGPDVLAGLVNHKNDIVELRKVCLGVFGTRFQGDPAKLSLKTIQIISRLTQSMYGIEIISKQVRIGGKYARVYSLDSLHGFGIDDSPQLNAYTASVADVYGE